METTVTAKTIYNVAGTDDTLWYVINQHESIFTG